MTSRAKLERKIGRTIERQAELEKLVLLVQDTVTRDGRAAIDFTTGRVDLEEGRPALARLRKLADDIAKLKTADEAEAVAV